MATEWLRTALARRDPILPRALEFLMLPTRYIHPAWADRLVGKVLWQQASSRQRGEAALCEHILSRVGASADDAIAFDGKAARLALLDGESLAAAAQQAGLALSAPAISGFVDRRSVVALKQAIGADAYELAVRESRLQPGQALATPEAGSVADLIRNAGALGWRCVAACVAGEPAGLVQRLRLKLDPGIVLEPAGEGPAIDRDRALRLIIKLVRETRPQWNSLLA